MTCSGNNPLHILFWHIFIFHNKEGGSVKHSLIKLTSLLITAVLLFSVMAAAPFAVFRR